MSGADFDKAYLAEVTRINVEDAIDVDREKASTHEPRIRAYLKTISSMDQKHTEVGEALKAKFG